jgi:hypothetical protein
MTWDALRYKLGSQNETIETLSNGSLRTKLNLQPIERIEELPGVEVIHAAGCTAACFRCPVSGGEVEILGELEPSKHGQVLVNGTATLTLTEPEPPKKST